MRFVFKQCDIRQVNLNHSLYWWVFMSYILERGMCILKQLLSVTKNRPIHGITLL